MWSRDLLKSLATDYEDDLARGYEEKTKAITMIINDGKLTVNNSIEKDNNFISLTRLNKMMGKAF